jgi:hypothetical protein
MITLSPVVLSIVNTKLLPSLDITESHHHTTPIMNRSTKLNHTVVTTRATSVICTGTITILGITYNAPHITLCTLHLLLRLINIWVVLCLFHIRKTNEGSSVSGDDFTPLNPLQYEQSDSMSTAGPNLVDT